jgi:hypothetical protein
MDLADYPAYPRAIVPQNDKKIFDDEAAARHFVDQFHVSQPLLVRTNLVPALDDVHSLAPKYAVGFAGGFEIQV